MAVQTISRGHSRYDQYADAMRVALSTAVRSPDPSTQNGAALFSGEGEMLAADCNRFPDGVTATSERLQRPAKYSFVEHAERMVIFVAARAGHRLANGTLVCPWAACAECARAIAQTGIVTLVRLPRSPGGPAANFTDSVTAGDRILAEARVQVFELAPAGLCDDLLPVLRNGRPWTLAQLAG